MPVHSFDQKLYSLIDSALEEDVGDGDHSTLASIPRDARGKAELKIKEDGVLAGVDIARKIFNYKDASAQFKNFKKDGDFMKPGELAFEIETYIHCILQCERLVLNCMQRMSGIATLTRKFVDKIKDYRTEILDTRKTTPNFRLLEKEAVKIGGAGNHRFGLYDMIMLKDNHIDFAGGTRSAIEKAHGYVLKNKKDLRIEIETRNIDEVKAVVEHGRKKVFRIMLDNFTPDQVIEALKIIGKDFETEVSGGINIDNIESYAKTGVDYISVGSLIHQAKSIDMSLKAKLIS